MPHVYWRSRKTRARARWLDRIEIGLSGRGIRPIGADHSAPPPGKPNREAALLAIALAGCAAEAGVKAPCEKGGYGYVSLGKRKVLRTWCAACGDQSTCCSRDGKFHGCLKNPAECPEDAKDAGK